MAGGEPLGSSFALRGAFAERQRTICGLLFFAQKQLFFEEGIFFTNFPKRGAAAPKAMYVAQRHGAKLLKICVFCSMRARILTEDFYRSEDVLQVARALLGKLLVTKLAGVRTSGIITEVEAYRAPDDRACHAYGNRCTARTEVMFRAGGCAYIYLCYGMHHLFNVVTGPEGMAHAVLVRAIEPLEGVEEMLRRRGKKEVQPQLTTGPGVLSRALGLHKDMSGENLLSGERVWIEDIGREMAQHEIGVSPRIGVDYAGESALWPWRFFIRGSKWVKR